MSNPDNDFTSGTGLGNVILPGDPNNNLVLSVVGTYGSVDVTWTYPTVNPNGVSHFKLFRGITSVFGNALLHRIVAGNSYHDLISTEGIQEYYYWIQLISVNGTVMSPIGPQSATPLNTLELLLDTLEGNISAVSLTPELRAEIDEIPGLDTQITTESATRVTENTLLGTGLTGVQGEVTSALGVISLEAVTRATNDAAISDALDVEALFLRDKIANATASSTGTVELADGWKDVLSVAITLDLTCVVAVIATIQYSVPFIAGTPNESGGAVRIISPSDVALTTYDMPIDTDNNLLLTLSEHCDESGIYKLQVMTTDDTGTYGRRSLLLLEGKQ